MQVLFTNIPYIYFLQILSKMNATLLTLLAFCIALAIGIYIGKLLFSAKSQSEKIGLEEKLIGLTSQFKALQEQLKTNQFEKETIRTEKDSLELKSQTQSDK